ncbi:putative methylenetetrahydrofolate dehydrogenase-like protein [Trypanosoma theileri]|uniref:Putative methylenetetrahydrofolate dehydrogenase-like protein n=1 Tax=Trypanosoma theileri TaxID=67003 RepID=A0A1X0NT48_9TRYP|nr:putative methylenetetrahydrofolate dehydrogenase-like protein [Trypanosoma theileri]ORC87885.1 putative methylenetetrahydrofolate dehydrogenase-like protein [Trypanosoma theileri]
MPAEILSGRGLSAVMLERIKSEISLLRRPPSLAVVMIGDRQDSQRYVAMKRRAAERCGISFHLHQLPASVQQQQLHRELQWICRDESIDGVLLQLPLPSHLRVRPALLCIHPQKDVDGLHPLNAGNLFLHENPIYAGVLQRNFSIAKAETLVSRHLVEGKYFVPCTAMAVRALLFSYLNKTTISTEEETITVEPEQQSPAAQQRNLHAVIMNKSMVVGVPTAALLQREQNIMVTLCNRSNDLDAVREVSRHADVLVTALGIPRVVTADFIKPGAIVIDVAINEDNSSNVSNNDTLDKPRRLCGDVDMISVREKAAAVTPVPGGVGPLTVAYLMQNTLKAYYFSQQNISVFSSLLSMHRGGEGKGKGGNVAIATGEASRSSSSVLKGDEHDGGSSTNDNSNNSSEDHDEGSDSSFGVC